MPTWLARLARPAALVAVSLAVVGCTKSLDTSDLRSTLKSQLESQLGSTGWAVSCPPSIKVSAGATFQCTASDPSGKTLTIEVTQQDNQGHVSWKITGTGSSSASPAASPTT